MERQHHERVGRKTLAEGERKVWRILNLSDGTFITDHYSYFIEWAQEMKKVLVSPAVDHSADQS
jgi:hypothetical protein